MFGLLRVRESRPGGLLRMNSEAHWQPPSKSLQLKLKAGNMESPWPTPHQVCESVSAGNQRKGFELKNKLREKFDNQPRRLVHHGRDH